MKCPLHGGLHRVNQSSSGVEAAGESLSRMDTEGQEETTKESRTQMWAIQCVPAIPPKVLPTLDKLPEGRVPSPF